MFQNTTVLKYRDRIANRKGGVSLVTHTHFPHSHSHTPTHGEELVHSSMTRPKTTWVQQLYSPLRCHNIDIPRDAQIPSIIGAQRLVPFLKDGAHHLSFSVLTHTPRSKRCCILIPVKTSFQHPEPEATQEGSAAAESYSMTVTPSATG